MRWRRPILNNAVLFLFAALLFIADGLLAKRVFETERLLKAARAAETARSGPRKSLGSLSGIDSRGNYLDLRFEEPWRVLVPVLHDHSVESDVRFWNDLARIGRTRRVAVVGFCEGRECVAKIRSGQAAPGFPIIGYGSFVAANTIGRYDRDNMIVVSDPSFRIAKVIPRPSTIESARHLLNELGS